MKVLFDKNELCEAVEKVIGCASAKSTIKEIEGILITTDGDASCRLCAYDLEKGIKTEIGARVEESGSIIVNAVRLYSIIKAMPSDVLMESADEKKVKISSGRSEFNIGCQSGDSYPAIPDFIVDRSFQVKKTVLKSMINQTVFAVAKEDQRVCLTGIFFKVDDRSIILVSCDSFRLAIRTKNTETLLKSKQNETELNFIVPLRTAVELSKLLDEDGDVRVALTRKHIMFSFERTVGGKEKELILFSRLIDAPYIEYMRFITANNKIFVHISRDEFRASLERATLITEEKSNGQIKRIVKCSFENNLLNIYADSETGTTYDEINVRKEGDDITIGFNCRYLLDALRAADDENLKLSMSSPLMSMIIEGETEKEDGSFLYLSLPIRLKD